MDIRYFVDKGYSFDDILREVKNMSQSPRGRRMKRIRREQQRLKS